MVIDIFSTCLVVSVNNMYSLLLLLLLLVLLVLIVVGDAAGVVVDVDDEYRIDYQVVNGDDNELNMCEVFNII